MRLTCPAEVVAGHDGRGRRSGPGTSSRAVQPAARAGAHVLAAVRSQKKTAAVPAAAHEILVGDAAQAGATGAQGGVDVLLDSVGGDTVPTLLPAVRPGGRVVLIGYVAGTTLSVDLPALLAKDIALLPVNMVRRKVPVDVFHTLLDDLGTCRLHLHTTTHAFTDLGKAIAARGTGAVSGALAVTL
ncbi:zinc-binding dehydrogenase [Streptomyces sp. NPDC046939]|uniref:zinc-binding dehydrogenase n=1 Tax=Streptomyces sp. NPDC046939 TaxID=3155376 RepID=UPI0034100A3A